MNEGDIGIGVLIGLLIAAAIALIVAISYSNGEAWDKCYPNGTCDKENVCMQDKCVPKTAFIDAGVK